MTCRASAKGGPDRNSYRKRELTDCHGRKTQPRNLKKPPPHVFVFFCKSRCDVKSSIAPGYTAERADPKDRSALQSGSRNHQNLSRKHDQCTNPC